MVGFILCRSWYVSAFPNITPCAKGTLIIPSIDYTTLLDLLPPKDQQSTRRALARVKPRAEEAKARETAEMMGKLKDLGNSLLGTPTHCFAFGFGLFFLLTLGF